MVRRGLLPDDKIHPIWKKRRDEFKQDSAKHEKVKNTHKEYYKKNKVKLQIQKKRYIKKLREEEIETLGGKCVSCGVGYNPNAIKSNLEFDHKFYLKSKSSASLPHYQIRDLIKQGIDPNEQFMLLCHTCHMVVTYSRIDPEKARLAYKLMSKLGII